jgi:N-acetyl-anhydromuramyl-L-alanine amidase AmpD
VAVWVPSPNLYYSRRTGIKWIVWHSTESNEVTGGAYRVAAGWFGKKASRASAHIVVDDGSDPRYPDGVVECVKPGDTAWHAARGNAAGYGIEIIGRAGQGAVAWSDPYSLAAIRNACRWIRSNRALAHIPARWLTDSQLRASEVGHIVHAQVSRVLGGTTHTDPGLGFPFAYVMEQLGSSTVPAVKTPDAGKRTLRQGSDGIDVRNLQQSLNAMFPSYSSLVVDGQFGPATAAVVKEFQGRVGLTKDGIVGPNTWTALARFGI